MALFGAAEHPQTGEPLGARFRTFRSAEDRIAARIAALGDSPDTVAVERITAEEHRRGERRAVAGFDLTFRADKTVSVLWAVAPSS